MNGTRRPGVGGNVDYRREDQGGRYRLDPDEKSVVSAEALANRVAACSSEIS